MALARTVVETVTCDVCGKALRSRTPKAIAFGDEVWELDLCEKDLASVTRQIKAWTTGARQVKRRRSGKQAEDEWSYLESIGFTRHRGRKSAAEAAALRKRR